MTEIIIKKVSELKPWDRNPRSIDDASLKRLKGQLQKFKQYKPLIINQDNIVLGGNMRLRAMRELGINEVWVSVVETANEAEMIEYALSDNDRAGKYEQDLLNGLVVDFPNVDWGGFSVDAFPPVTVPQLIKSFNDGLNDKDRKSLNEKFIVPPFSVLDTRQGYWQERKDAWLSNIGNLTETKENVLGGAENMLSSINNGSSNFDPVLAEIVYKWFCPVGGVVLDPFAGEQTKGYVAGAMGLGYTGVEIRPEQVEVDQAASKEFKRVNYICGSSENIKTLVKQDNFDLVFTSPPYFDLEIYSENKDDISSFKTYEEFIKFYANVLEQSAAKLAPNRFLVVKVGEIRDKKGIYRNFVGDNVTILNKIGLNYYNEMILVNAVGTARLRASMSMRNRKIVKTHQNVLVFFKGDPQTIKDNFPELSFKEIENAEPAKQ